ncbi:type II secretion system protein N [Salinibius halmophilus]|uniref:type II secretion system protein N n=1 Tax=Salinibius halmophilus TaxID=1853216 RepID=UPI000E67348D|nr:type II secretion system protein N [Salinibius halmophilus]
MNAIKASKFGLSLAVFVCVTLAGYVVSQIIWTAATTEREIVVPAVQPEQLSSGASVAMQALEVAQANLFGEYRAPQAPQPTPVPTPAPPPPRTPLTFELQGVMAGPNGTGTASIARSAGQRGELFRVGDTVYGQATIKSIYPGGVIFDRNGTEETLAFNDEQLIGDGTGLTQTSNTGMASVSVGQAPVYRVNESTGTTTTFTNRSTQRGSQNAVSSNRGPSADAIPPGAPSTTEEARNMAQSIIQGAQQDPERVLARYGLRVVDNGYMVTGNARLLMAASLRPGDVVVAVDGVPVGDPAIDARRLQSVMAKTSLQVDVIRDGRNVIIKYRIPSLF